ncbi:hypothetical protein MCOR07_009174 [Pyricularia oryzae]|uniref:Uncharacterized protein n=1 Tax=Pyricularia grisea TaxID=148305 RepID=A0ABQ8N5R7_PYRGI|nr:hypothetical protein MCOR01_000517 [Pyricularia oryzae]KAI6291767.1 hypothetical protein MCOR33_010368 [Pyricularia grisea]KAI6270689.1 hypothetical protein MCOR26_008137 [Pyricularia oryzae]KAI6333050.1 hypothetical protein MCOR28_010642 [Pyricularia oryzae]KAI6356551.1 hypothetical protein MCOR31_010703 [Pyricularia oryzae]
MFSLYHPKCPTRHQPTLTAASKARSISVSTIAIGLELLFSLVVLVVTCKAYPDKYRTLLWSIGGKRGWNSNPDLRIYFYANHGEPPEVPLIWTQSLTDSTMAIAVLSFVLCLARVVLRYYDAAFLAIDVLYDGLLAALWYYNVASQSSADLTDPKHLSARPWYLDRSCSVVSGHAEGACMVAKATFYLAVCSMILYLSKLFLTCMWTAYRCGEQGLLTDHLGPEKLFFRLRINRDLCFRHDLEYWDNGESKVMSV